MENFDYIKRNYEELIGEIDELSGRVGTSGVRLVSVTKSGSDEELIALCRAGAMHIGENRPQELRRRADLLSSLGLCPSLHEIGTLQRNKVKTIIPDVSLIHSVDSLRLAEEISRQAVKQDRSVRILIEVNSAREENKSGILPEEAERLAEDIMALPSIELCGLMTMGPVCEDPEDIRIYFRETRTLFDRMRDGFGFGDEPILSMGMSDSYRVAIEEGSNLVRVGRRLFKK